MMVDTLRLLEETPTYTEENALYEINLGNDFIGYMRVNRDIPEEIDSDDESILDTLYPDEEAHSYLRPVLERYSAPELAFDIDEVYEVSLVDNPAENSLDIIDEHGESYIVSIGHHPERRQAVGEAILRGDLRNEWQLQLQEIQYLNPGEAMAGELVFPNPPPSVNDALVDRIEDPNSSTGIR